MISVVTVYHEEPLSRPSAYLPGVLEDPQGPQRTVLAPFLFTLYTADFSINSLTAICNSSLTLPQHRSTSLTPVNIQGVDIEIVDSYQYLAKMAASCSFVPLVLLLCLSVAVEMRSSSYRDNKQVLQSLFGSRLAALIMAPPTPDDITEASAVEPTATPPSERWTLRQNDSSGLVDRQGAVPQLLLDFLQRQTKTGRRSRKSMFGGRGCFGMKLDRIGSISGLGC
ncbi:C-type natriuretic peptide 2 [Nematolebias whitei]|uniref:C-type natriuretic peptide 2 n=1 Tax=Nematolebias whitei TaxID=451745 RepID=UPI001897D9B6|nr:C-type natriuretic peptide 2 [Nematolebias whitei]